MPRQRFDKKKAQTYAMVYRAHDDPLYHDSEALERVFVPVANPNHPNAKPVANVRTAKQLEAALAPELESGTIRGNEGEAAIYGITYDDSKYDYMQHLRPMGQLDGTYIAKKEKPERGTKTGIVFKEDLLEAPSNQPVLRSYQEQQNVPDSIAGFQPDMDPALREVLGALDDEAYLETQAPDEDDEVFATLLAGGEADEDEEEYDEWDMDNVEDEYAAYDSDGGESGVGGWEQDFARFQKLQKKVDNPWDLDDEYEGLEMGDTVALLPSKSTGKSRKKKGAMTDTLLFLMTSSALHRTEGMTLLDDRYETMTQTYEEEEEANATQELAPLLMAGERADFESMLDEFLDTMEVEGGRRLVKKNPEVQRLKDASDAVLKGKLASRRKKERAAGNVDGIAGRLAQLRM